MWVVADITRAVDDKTARDLLGEHFRRQLLMDGQYGALSFVCTKTDSMKASEIRRYCSDILYFFSQAFSVLCCYSFEMSSVVLTSINENSADFH